LLDEIEREGFRVLHQRVALTPLRKLWIAWRTWVFGPTFGRVRSG
jgi:phytoene synthase